MQNSLINNVIIKEMNEVLEKTTIQERFNYKNINILSNTVLITINSNMHKVLKDYVYPPIKELEVFHYTTEESEENIKNTAKFRLYCILKRYGEGELTPFLKKFDFDKAFDERGQLKDINNYRNIFYASFIKVPDDERNTNEMNHFECLFAKKLKFRITSTKGYFRKINYENDTKFDLFNKFKTISDKYSKKLVIEKMSGEFASFCISEENEIENEYRIYWRHWNKMDGFKVKKDDNSDTFIEIELNKENFAGIKIELIS